jgi:hypothetical protein
LISKSKAFFAARKGLSRQLDHGTKTALQIRKSMRDRSVGVEQMNDEREDAKPPDHD